MEIYSIYSRLNLEWYAVTVKIFLEINLTFLIDLFISYFNILYLLFTEISLYAEDLVANGIWSFSTFHICFNILIVAGVVAKIVKSRNSKSMFGISLLKILL